MKGRSFRSCRSSGVTEWTAGCGRLDALELRSCKNRSNFAKISHPSQELFFNANTDSGSSTSIAGSKPLLSSTPELL
jgi:hypothetical protein